MSDVVPSSTRTSEYFVDLRPRRRTLVAARLVEDHGYKDRDHPDPGVRDPVRASGGVHLYRRHQGRGLDDDRRAGHRGLHLRRNRQAHPDTAQHRFRGDLRDLHSLGACLLQADPAPDREIDHRVHQVHQLPLPLHRLHHRRQHPGDGSQGSGEGLRQDIRAARARLDRGGRGRNPGRDHAGARRPPQLLLCRASHHGRRRRRRRDSAFDRVFGNPAPTAGRRVRADPAADHARQPDCDHPVRYSELRRQAISEA